MCILKSVFWHRKAYVWYVHVAYVQIILEPCSCDTLMLATYLHFYKSFSYLLVCGSKYNVPFLFLLLWGMLMVNNTCLMWQMLFLQPKMRYSLLTGSKCMSLAIVVRSYQEWHFHCTVTQCHFAYCSRNVISDATTVCTIYLYMVFNVALKI